MVKSRNSKLPLTLNGWSHFGYVHLLYAVCSTNMQTEWWGQFKQRVQKKYQPKRQANISPLKLFNILSKLFTRVSGATLAAVVVGELDAAVGSTRVTGVWQTLVHVSLTALPNISRRADAVVASDSIHTLAFVEALWLFSDWVSEGSAVVHIDLTVNTWRLQWKSKGESTMLSNVHSFK